MEKQINQKKLEETGSPVKKGLFFGRKRKFIWLGGILLFLMIFFVMAVGSWRFEWSGKLFSFPAVLVGWQGISVKDFNDMARAMKQSYEAKTLTDEGLAVNFSSEEGKNVLAVLRKAVLEKMIEDKIIVRALKNEKMENLSELLEREIDNALEKVGNKETISQGAFLLYGWDMAQFRKNILIVQVQRELLFRAFEKKGVNWLDWLEGEKQKANIFIFLSKYGWDKKEGRLVFRDNDLKKYEEQLREKTE